MGYKSVYIARKKVELDERYWVVLQPLVQGQEDEAQVALFGQAVFETGLTDMNDIRAKLNHKDYAHKQLELGIVDWNLDDDDGKVLPINEENIRGLTPAHHQKLLMELRGVTTPFKSAQEKTELG